MPPLEGRWHCVAMTERWQRDYLSNHLSVAFGDSSPRGEPNESPLINGTSRAPSPTTVFYKFVRRRGGYYPPVSLPLEGKGDRVAVDEV